MEKRAVLLLKAAFILGGIVDGLALIPMIFTDAARLFWGFTDFSATYKFAMYMAATFMLAWTILLFWAYRKPLERKFIAFLTILIVFFFVIIQLFGIASNIVAFGKMLPSFIMQSFLLGLFSYSFFYSRGISSTLHAS